MNKIIGFGIIGLGSVAQVHVKAIESLENAKFVAGYHKNIEKAEAFCKPRKAIGYDNLDAFLANKEIDIVSIATPSGAHLEVALASIRAKKHVIIEKPMEISKERCELLIKEAENYNVMLAGIFQSRCYESSLLVKKAIEEGRFGKLTMVDAQVKWYRSQEYYDSNPWRGTWAMDGGGALMNQSIHAIDLLQWLVGPIEELFAYTATLAHERIEVEDTAVATVKFKNGALGVIEGTTAAYPGFFKKLELCGTEGSVILEEESLKAWSFKRETAEDGVIREKHSNCVNSSGGATDPKAINFKGHALVFKDMVDSLLSNRSPMVDGKEAKKAVEIIEAIYKSAKEHCAVKL